MTSLLRLFAGPRALAGLALAGAATALPAAESAVVATTVANGPVVEVRSAGPADLVLFAAGAEGGWRVGMPATVVRGGETVARLLVVGVGERATAALIREAAPGQTIRAGDTVTVPTLRF